MKPALGGRRIRPRPITADTGLTELVDGALLAYNGARLREACQLLTRKMLEPDVVVGLSLTGALTPAGLGLSALGPLIRAGFVDWIVSTGANLYHDAHFALDLELHTAAPGLDDRALCEQQVVRIYDILFDYDVLLQTDAFFRQVIAADEFQRSMSTAEFHYRVGRYVRERERALGCEGVSLLGVAWEAGVPVYTSSPGDSSIGMNVARHALEGGGLRLDVTLDVNETAAIVLEAKTQGRSAVCILGGGSPKNFVLQTVPQIQEVLGIDERGHDYFLQVTDARPDTGGLSGATPSEAVTWGKVDPEQLPDAVTCYADSTIALPLMTAYALRGREPRPLRRLYDRREELLGRLETAFRQARDAASEHPALSS